MNPTARRLLLCLLLTPILAYAEFLVFKAVFDIVLWSPEGLFGDFPTPTETWEKTPELAGIIAAISFAQLASLLIPLPIQPAKGPAAPLIGRALLGGFVITAALAVPLVALLDLPIGLAEPGSKLPGWDREVMHAVIAAWALSWLGFTALLTHRGREQPDALERAVSRSTAGTAVGLALATPWYLALRRKQQCHCALSTFCALILGIWSLVVVAGPLLLLARRDRRRRLTGEGAPSV